MIFLTAVESVLSIVLIIALGFYLRNKGWFADSFAGNISKLIMNIALSASIFVSVLTYLTRDKLMALSDGLIYGALSIVFGYLIAWLMVKVLKVRRGRRGGQRCSRERKTRWLHIADGAIQHFSHSRSSRIVSAQTRLLD